MKYNQRYNATVAKEASVKAHLLQLHRRSSTCSFGSVYYMKNRSNLCIRLQSLCAPLSNTELSPKRSSKKRVCEDTVTGIQRPVATCFTRSYSVCYAQQCLAGLDRTFKRRVFKSILVLQGNFDIVGGSAFELNLTFACVVICLSLCMSAHLSLWVCVIVCVYLLCSLRVFVCLISLANA